MQHLLMVYYGKPHKSLVLSSDSEMLGCATYNVTPFKKSINLLLITCILQYNQHFSPQNRYIKVFDKKTSIEQCIHIYLKALHLN